MPFFWALDESSRPRVSARAPKDVEDCPGSSCRRAPAVLPFIQGPMLRPILHMVLHVAVPGVVARVAWRERVWSAWAIMVATAAVDLDHFLANPIYDPNRCSIGFHPLHSVWAMGAYVLLMVPRRTRLVGAGLVIHMVLDGIDCLLI